ALPMLSSLLYYCFYYSRRTLGPLIVVIVAAGQIGCAGVESYRVTPGAVQSVYLNGVPHTDRTGKDRLAYDAQISFFPIGIYHALHGEFAGHRYDFRVLA